MWNCNNKYGKIPGPGRRVEISDSIELCIVELTRVDCILNLNSDILTPPSLTLNTFGTMQPVIKAILFKKCSQQLLYGFPYEATISIHALVQEFSPGGWIQGVSAIIFFLSSTYFIEVNWFISKKILIFHDSRGGSINSSRGEDGVQLFPGGGGGYPGA